MGSINPVTSLAGATTGNGAAADFEEAKANISMIVIPSGTIALGTVALDVSQDGDDWVQVGITPTILTGTNASLTVNGAWRYARGRVGTNITGGGSVSATLMEAG